MSEVALARKKNKIEEAAMHLLLQASKVRSKICLFGEHLRTLIIGSEWVVKGCVVGQSCEKSSKRLADRRKGDGHLELVRSRMAAQVVCSFLGLHSRADSKRKEVEGSLVWLSQIYAERVIEVMCLTERKMRLCLRQKLYAGVHGKILALTKAHLTGDVWVAVKYGPGVRWQVDLLVR